MSQMPTTPDPNYPQPPPVPLRAMPLEYVRSGQAPRPGLVTAIGVMSIVVASLSMLANLSMGMMGFGFLVASRMPVAVTTTSTVTVTGTTAPAAGAASGVAFNEIRGLQQPARGVIVTALADVRPLSAERRRMLDALLAECGQDVFPFPPEQITAQRVRANVSEHGRLPAGTTRGGADYFATGNGRVDVADSIAAFVPDDGEPVIVTADESGAVSVASGPVSGATTTFAAGPPFNPFAGVTSTPPLLLGIFSVLSFGLAIYLLVIGIMVLRNSPRGARLHWVYVALKMPLAVGVGLAYAWTMSQLLSGMQATVGAAAGAPMPAPMMTWLWVFYAVIVIVLGWAYPIGLIFTLRSRTVREFFIAAKGGADADAVR